MLFMSSSDPTRAYHPLLTLLAVTLASPLGLVTGCDDPRVGAVLDPEVETIGTPAGAYAVTERACAVQPASAGAGLHLLASTPLDEAPICGGPLVWARSRPVVADLTPDDLAPFDHLGMRVAVSGRWVVAGADGDDASPWDAGVARVWLRTADGFEDHGPLVPSRVAPSEHFGWSVAAGDGVLAVGAPGADVDGVAGAGAVEVYLLDEHGVWRSRQRLVAPTPAYSGAFGDLVRLDGERLVVGAPGEAADRGAAYVFRRVGAAGGFAFEGRLVPADALVGGALGRAVAIDGALAVVGAPEGADGGAAWVFRFDNGAWVDAGRLAPPVLAPGARFGGSVAIRDGLVLVGADGDLVGDLEQAGSVWVFEPGWDGDGAWRVRARLTDPLPRAQGHFGGEVHFDGQLAAVGAWQGDGAAPGAGAVTLFTPTKGAWTPLARLVDLDGAPGDRFGVGVGLGAGLVVVGAWSSDTAGTDAGRLLAFSVTDCEAATPAATRR